MLQNLLIICFLEFPQFSADCAHFMLSRYALYCQFTQRKKIDLHKCTNGLHMMHICITICATYAFCSKYIVHVRW